MEAALAVYVTLGIPAMLGSLVVANRVLDLYERWQRVRERRRRRRRIGSASERHRSS